MAWFYGIIKVLPRRRFVYLWITLECISGFGAGVTKAVGLVWAIVVLPIKFNMDDINKHYEDQIFKFKNKIISNSYNENNWLYFIL